MTYEQRWSSPHPGCLIVLVDQSESMEDPFGGASVVAGASKAVQVAFILNTVLEDYLRVNASGATYKERVRFAVLGYSGDGVHSALPTPLGEQDFVSLAELAQHPRRQEVHTREKRNPDGERIEVRSTATIWVDPVMTGPTPMCAAFRRATELASGFAKDHPESYPPLVINISDGLATDGDIDAAARALLAVETQDGKALLFNCHITKQQLPAVEFARSEADVPDKPEAKGLFWLSSRIPLTARTAYQRATGRQLVEGTRGYIFNGDALSVRKMLTFGTTSANQPDRH